MFKELKETIREMSNQTENINKKIEIMERNQTEKLEVKSTRIRIKISKIY